VPLRIRSAISGHRRRTSATNATVDCAYALAVRIASFADCSSRRVIVIVERIAPDTDSRPDADPTGRRRSPTHNAKCQPIRGPRLAEGSTRYMRGHLGIRVVGISTYCRSNRCGAWTSPAGTGATRRRWSGPARRRRGDPGAPPAVRVVCRRIAGNRGGSESGLRWSSGCLPFGSETRVGEHPGSPNKRIPRGERSGPTSRPSAGRPCDPLNGSGPQGSAAQLSSAMVTSEMMTRSRSMVISTSSQSLSNHSASSMS